MAADAPREAAEQSDPPADAVNYLETEGVAVLTLNEPNHMNALSSPLKAALAAHIARAMANPQIRCLLLTGSGKAFCAGGDLRSMSQREPLAVRQRMQVAHGWARQLMQGNKPVVGAVNGAAAGAGLSLALMCDVLLASEKATFMAGFSAIGAAPDLGVAYTLPRAVGVKIAKDLLLTGRKLDAREALACGLVSRVVAHGQLQDEAFHVARQLAAGPASLGLTKQLVNLGAECGLEALLAQEALAQATAFGSADFGEGVSAFMERRSPVFRGC